MTHCPLHSAKNAMMIIEITSLMFSVLSCSSLNYQVQLRKFAYEVIRHRTKTQESQSSAFVAAVGVVVEPANSSKVSVHSLQLQQPNEALIIPQQIRLYKYTRIYQ